MKLYSLLATLINAGVLYDQTDEVELHQLENFAFYESPQNFENPDFFDEEIFKYQLKDKVKVYGDCTATGTDCSKEKNVIKRELTAIICSQGFLKDVIREGTCEIISEYYYPELVHFWGMSSTLTAIIFLHYTVATKMALEILGSSICRVRLRWLVSPSLEVSKLVYAWLEGDGAIFRGFLR